MYQYFDDMPIAFSAIEIIRDDKYEPVNFTFKYMNKAYEKLLRISSKEMNGQNFNKTFTEMNKK